MVGLGTDIVNIKRMGAALARHPVRLPVRILHASELSEYYNSRQQSAFLAKRFAAKEAVAKALGCGFSHLSAKEIKIYHHKSGQPYVKLPNRMRQQVLITIADEKEYAVATALALDTTHKKPQHDEI